MYLVSTLLCVVVGRVNVFVVVVVCIFGDICIFGVLLYCVVIYCIVGDYCTVWAMLVSVW